MSNLCYEMDNFQIKFSRLEPTVRRGAIYHLKALNLAILTMYGTPADSWFKPRKFDLKTGTFIT